jgi:phage terminase large subunit GpA-like protein
VNATLAEPWVLRVTVATEQQVLKARTDLPPQTIPQGAVALTCGIDCQKYGFWFVVRAWARDFSSWLIHYGFLATWDDVEQLLFESAYPRQGSGHMIRIWRAAVDSGGGDTEDGLSMTEQVYFWVRGHNTGRTCRVWATKGASTEIAGAVAKYGETRDRTPSGKPLRGGLQLVLIDTAKMKETVFERLNSAVAGTGFQPAYLHSGTGQDYANQITAEEKRRDRRGRIEWVRVRKDNHLLDAECLCMALVDPTWPGGGLNLIRGPLNANTPESGAKKEQEKPRQTPRVNPWLGRRVNPFYNPR